jgi:hypothetical protein
MRRLCETLRPRWASLEQTIIAANVTGAPGTTGIEGLTTQAISPTARRHNCELAKRPSFFVSLIDVRRMPAA